MEKTYRKKYKHLTIDFVGTEQNENINYEKIDVLFDSCFCDSENYKDTKTIIANVRTILRDFKENKLEILFCDNDTTIIVKYKDEKLTFFSLEGPRKNENNEDVMLHAEFSEPLEFSFSFYPIVYTEANQKVEIDNLEIQKIIKGVLRRIYFLENIHPIQIDARGKRICELYKSFYGENPNFSDKDINTKIQMMVCILNVYDITDDYIFNICTYENQSIAISEDLTMNIERLKPLGEINILDNLDASDYTNRRIKIIGNLVKEYTQNGTNNMAKLITILYTKKQYERVNHLVENDKNALLSFSQTSGHSLEDVKESIELVRKINQKIEEKEV